MSVSKITLFCPSLRGGGAERAMLNLAIGFAEHGLRVDLVLASASGPLVDRVPDEVRLIDLGARRVLTCLPALIRYLKEERPEAMISALDYANLVAIWSRRIASVPVRLIVSERNTMSQAAGNASSLRDRVMPLLVRRFYPWADAVVAVSQGVADDLVRTTGLPADSVHTIYNPTVVPELFKRAEEPLRHPWFAPGEPDVILAVGRLTRQKDFPTLIRAFASLRAHRPARLLILGEGEARPQLEALVQRMGLDSSVMLHGFEANPYPFMARAAVFALSSAWEGLPNALIEALALDTTVVSTDCPSGPREILENGAWGRLVPVGDAEAMADALSDSLAEPPGCDAGAAVQRFTRPAAVAKFLELVAP